MVSISLTSPMRSNLLALQNISKVQSATQERLSTGLKVSNAIDNPASYYTAQSLNNRASDLNMLLDSMGQGIQTIKATSEAIEAGAKLLEQAKASANAAMDVANVVPSDFEIDGEVVATVSTEYELLDAIKHSGKGIIVIDRNITMSKNIGLELKDGQSLVGAKYLDKNDKETKITFDFDNEIKAIGIDLGDNSALSDLVIDYTSLNKTNNNDFHAVRNKSGNSTEINNVDITVNSDDKSTFKMAGIRNGGNIELFGEIGINASSKESKYIFGILGADNNSANLIQSKGSSLNISTSGEEGYGMFFGKNNLSEVVNITTIGAGGHGIGYGENNLSGTIDIKTSGYNSDGIVGSESIISGRVAIATDKVSAYGIVIGKSTITSTGELLFEIKESCSFYNANIEYEAGAKIGIKDYRTNGLLQANVGGMQMAHWNNLDWADFTRLGDFPTPADISELLSKKASGEQSELSEKDDKKVQYVDEKLDITYNNILEQYNALIKDAGYKGVNLLDLQNMRIVFNEDRSSILDVEGVDASSKGLGLGKAEWLTKDDILASIDELDKAINQLRTYSNEFGNYLNTVATREDFTDRITNVLTEGADKLTLADMNEESANMLALQTRQQLAINSLALSSQAAQSILSLF